MDSKGTPSIYLILINGTLYLFYLFILSHNTKKESLKNTLQNKSGEEALNRNHRAYNIRLPQLQLMMATHAQLQVYNN